MNEVARSKFTDDMGMDAALVFESEDDICNLNIQDYFRMCLSLYRKLTFVNHIRVTVDYLDSSAQDVFEVEGAKDE